MPSDSHLLSGVPWVARNALSERYRLPVGAAGRHSIESRHLPRRANDLPIILHLRAHLPARRHPLALAPILAVALWSAAELPADPLPQLEPHSGQSAEHVDWWAKTEAIESMLRRQKWKGALKQARRISGFVVRESWNEPDLDRVLGRLARQQAIAEINLGEDRDAVWHWWMVWNLSPELVGDLPDGLGRAHELVAARLRAAEEIPAGFDRHTDLEVLELEPPRFPAVEPPDLVANAAAVERRQPDVLIEAVLDAGGRLLQPVVISEDAHPVLVYTALDWLRAMPLAEPARLRGEAVDSLQLLTVSFALERTGGQIFLPPEN